MKISLPFPYKARVVPRRGRQPQEFQTIGFVDLDIAEITAAQAPAAIRIEAADTKLEKIKPNDIGPPRSAKWTAVEYREFEGHLLRPCAPLRMLAEHELIDPHILASPPSRTRIRKDLLSLVEDARAEGKFYHDSLRFWPIVSIIEKIGAAIPEGELSGDVVESTRDARRAELVGIMQHAAFIDGLLHVPSEGPMLALVDGSTGGYDIGKRQLRAIINAVGEKAWAEGNRFSLRLATHDDPAFAQQVTRLIRTISRRRNWGGIKAPPNPHPLIMGRISGQRNLSADRIAGASSGAAGRIRGVVQVALHQTRILLNEMTPDGIRNYVALRAAARDGASAEDIARLALEFSGASAAQDRTGRFARTVAPLRRISEEILGAQEAGPITGPGGPR